ncbi:MAG: hypothetical protein JRH01_22650 [Deltaproteobacteria bacterium]|nr:hypothetical protein [Deltaproteobacteria bacterium]MBW2392947.1 hypothetical protein [Deltaproteobacteria bacterium]
MRRFCFLVLGLSLLLGCVVGTYSEGMPVDPARVAEIRPGTTTKADLLAWFGPPSNFSDASLLEDLILSEETTGGPGGGAPRRFSDILAWQAYEGRINGLVMIIFNSLKIRADSDLLVVFFDDDDVVKYFGFRQSQERD